MTEIVLASRNKKKIAELQALIDSSLLGEVKILSLSDIGFEEDIDEYGDSFEMNSLIKAAVPASMGYIGIADDSGLCVDALGGEPGIFSARYSTDECETGDIDAANRAKILSKMDGIPTDKRGASFVCVASLVVPEVGRFNVPAKYIACPAYSMGAKINPLCAASVRGECRGEILEYECGEGGFGYDKIFYSGEIGKSFAEASQAEKNSVSHRGRAMTEFVSLIAEVVKTGK